MKLNRWGWAALLLSVGCGGTATYKPGDATTTKQPASEEGLGGAGGSGGTSIGTSGQVTPPASQFQPDIGVPVTGGGTLPASTGSCAAMKRPAAFAQPKTITGMSIALSDLHVYWNDGSAIMRQAKAGGDAEKVVDVAPNSARVAVNGNRLFWQTESTIESTALDSPSAGEPVAQRVLNAGWAVGGNQLYYMVDPTSGAGGTSGFNPDQPTTINATSLSGGASPPPAMVGPTSTLGTPTADATGAYWAHDRRNDRTTIGNGGTGGNPGAQGSSIQKLDARTGLVSDFAPINQIGPWNLQTSGEWLVWADNDGSQTKIWESKPDGSLRAPVGEAAIVRGFAVYGSTVYWAASYVGDERSDIWSAKLGGQSQPVLVACEVLSVDGLRADANDVYYFTYTAQPIIGRISAPQL